MASTAYGRLPRLNIALIMADAESLDSQLCTRLLARELRSSGALFPPPFTSGEEGFVEAELSGGAPAPAEAWMDALLRARAVRDGAPLPALHTHEATTTDGADTEPTVGEEDESHSRRGSSRRRGTQPLRASNGSPRSTSGVDAVPTQAESDARRAYLKAHWPSWEVVETGDGVPVVVLHALDGEDELIAAMGEASATGDEDAVSRCAEDGRGRLFSAVREACASPQGSGLSLAALSDLVVIWSVRHPCLLALLAAHTEPPRRESAAGVAVPRAAFYLQPGSGSTSPQHETTGGGGGAASAKRSGGSGGAGSRTQAPRSSSAVNSKKGGGTSGRTPARRTSASAKGRVAGGAGDATAAGEGLSLFFDEHTQSYNAAAVERFIYRSCPDFATFVERQGHFQEQLKQLQHWQRLSASSALETHASPSATLAAPECVSDSPLTTSLFAEDGDLLAANYHALVKSGAAAPTEAPSTESVLRLLEDCLFAARVTVPSLPTIAAYQTVCEGHTATASATGAVGASPLAASTRKKASTAVSASSTTPSQTPTSSAPAPTLRVPASVDCRDVILPVWLLATVPVTLGGGTDVLGDSPEASTAAAAALAAAFSRATPRLTTALVPLLGAVSLYAQWCRHRPVYPLAIGADPALPARLAEAPSGDLTGACASTTTATTLGGLSAAEADRLFVLGAPSTELQAEMTQCGEASPQADVTQAARGGADGTTLALTVQRPERASASALGPDPTRFTRYQELKRPSGTFTPLSATNALISQTLTNLERAAPLRLVKLADRGAAPSSLLLATTREEREDFLLSLCARRADLDEDAKRMGVRIEETDSGAHFASSPFHRQKGSRDADKCVPHTPSHDSLAAGTASTHRGFFRPYAPTLVAACGDGGGTSTSVLAQGPAARQHRVPNAELDELIKAYTASVETAAAQPPSESRPSTGRKPSSRSPSPAGRSGSRRSTAGAGGRVSGIAALDATTRHALVKQIQQQKEASPQSSAASFVVPNDHSAEQPFPPPYPEEVQWLVEQYVKKGLGYFAVSPSGGDTTTTAVASSTDWTMAGADTTSRQTPTRHDNTVYALAVRRMRELQGLPLRINSSEHTSSFLAARLLNANTALNTATPETTSQPSQGTAADASNNTVSSTPVMPLTPLDLVKRCALPLTTFEVQLQRSVERSLTSRERQHALQKVLLVELARAGGLLSYTGVEEVATHTGSLCAIEEVVSRDVMHRELLRRQLRFGDHLTAIYDFHDKPTPPSAPTRSAAAAAVNVLSDMSAAGAPGPSDAVMTSTLSHNAENVYPPRRAEQMWVAGLRIPPHRRRRMVFVHPFLGQLTPEQFIAVKAALAAADAKSSTTTKPGIGEPSRLPTTLYAQLLRAHLNQQSFVVGCRPGAPGKSQEVPQPTGLQVPPLRVSAEGREVVYPYCSAVVEVTTTAQGRRCAYIQEKEVVASLAYSVAPPPPPPQAVSAARLSETPAVPPEPESHSYFSVTFDDGLLFTCTPQTVVQAMPADGGPLPSTTTTAGRRPRSNTENDLGATRSGGRRASFIDTVQAPSPSPSQPTIPSTGGTGDGAEARRTGRPSAAAVAGKNKPARATRGGAAGADIASEDTVNPSTASPAAFKRLLTAPFTAVAPVGPSGGVRLWHARLPPAGGAPASAAPATESATAHSPTGRRGSFSTGRSLRGSGAGGKSTARTAAAMGITLTTSNFVLRCHPTANMLSMHYFGDERRPGSVGGNGCTTSWEAVDVVHEYRGAHTAVVTVMEREVSRTVDCNTGTVTRIFESGTVQLLFADGALSTRYPVDPASFFADNGDSEETEAVEPSSPTLSPPATEEPAKTGSISGGDGPRCVLELITSASGIRYVRRVTGGGADGASHGRVAHRCVRLHASNAATLQEVASYDSVHHCHMLARSDGVCSTYYYCRRGEGSQASPDVSSVSTTAARVPVQTPSSARKFTSGASGSSERPGEFDVVARVTLHTDGTTITTFAAAGGAFANPNAVSPSLAPLLEDVATVEAACNGGAASSSSAAVRWAIESSRMPRVFVIPSVAAAAASAVNTAAGAVPSAAAAAEGTIIPPTHAAPRPMRAGGGGGVAAASNRHDTKAGFYVILGDGTTLRRNVQVRHVNHTATSFLETVLSRPSGTAVRVVHDSALAIVEPADAMESNRSNPAALAVGECLPMFDLALGGLRLVDRRSHVTEVRQLYSPHDVDVSFAPQTWQQLLRQLVSPTYSPHRLPKDKTAALEAQHAEELAADRLLAEAGTWPPMLRRLRDLAEAFIVDKKLLHPDVLHNCQRTRFSGSVSTAAETRTAPLVPIKEGNHLIGVSPLFFSRLACGEFVQYLDTSDLQGILRQTDVEAGAPMFLARGSASGEPGVQQLTLFRVSVESDTSDTITSAALLTTNNAADGGGGVVGSPNTGASASGTRRGMSARVGAAKATSTYAQSSIISAFVERQRRLTVLFSGTTPASNYLHSSAKGSTGHFLDHVVAHPIAVLRGSSRWLPPALQPPRRFVRGFLGRGERPSSQTPVTKARLHRLIQLEEDAKLLEDLKSSNSSSYTLVRVFLEYEQLTLPAQNVVLQSELQRTSTLQELGRYHVAMTRDLPEVTADKQAVQHRLQEIYYAARKAKKNQEAQPSASPPPLSQSSQ